MMPGREALPWSTGIKDEDGKEIVIPTCDAKQYVNEEFFRCYRLYCTSEALKCLPFAGGWAEQPEWAVTALLVIGQEQRRYEREMAEEERKRKSNGRKYT